ncbi:MAG: preprotein translocase subunit YajC [Pseudonocardiales bacterium]|jgi:preprotein translocase subunit YajC|nr:preprotein translocase subunit YajC [Pseudonocardiales bacterium]
MVGVVKQALPLIILAALFVGLILFNRRNRERAAQAAVSRRDRLRAGSEVMTTSGLYATVVAVDTAEDTAVLSIAPGVEVKWTVAALREVAELPAQYREGSGLSESGGDVKGPVDPGPPAT